MDKSSEFIIMKKEEIHFSDWQRILLGEVPGSFYMELILRAAIIYLLLMLAMRLMGKRMSGLLSRNELVAMVSLAAAIGTPLTSPDRGIIPAVVIAIVVVYIERWISAKAFHDEKFERYAIGKLDILVNDAVIRRGNGSAYYHFTGQSSIPLKNIQRALLQKMGNRNLHRRVEEQTQNRTLLGLCRSYDPAGPCLRYLHQ
jgi:hypothetical protein